MVVEVEVDTQIDQPTHAHSQMGKLCGVIWM